MIWNIFGFLVLGYAHQIKKHLCKYSRNYSENIWITIFVNLIWIEEIPHTDSSEKSQLITHTIIVLFYRYNKKRRIFYHWPHQTWNKLASWYTSHTWMVLIRRQAQVLINQSNNINLNQPFQMADPVLSYVLSPF